MGSNQLFQILPSLTMHGVYFYFYLNFNQTCFSILKYFILFLFLIWKRKTEHKYNAFLGRWQDNLVLIGLIFQKVMISSIITTAQSNQHQLIGIPSLDDCPITTRVKSKYRITTFHCIREMK